MHRMKINIILNASMMWKIGRLQEIGWKMFKLHDLGVRLDTELSYDNQDTE